MNNIKTTTNEPDMVGITHIKHNTVCQHAPKCLKTYQVWFYAIDNSYQYYAVCTLYVPDMKYIKFPSYTRILI